MNTITEVEPGVTRIESGDRTIHLIGTAHVSRTSAELVDRVLNDLRPDTVCLELCESRLESLKNPEAWRNTDVFKVIKDGRGYVLMAQIILAGFQKRLAQQFGVQPGEEMRRALAYAQNSSTNLAVVDRNIRITLKRAWSGSGLWGFAKIVASLIESMFVKDDMSEAQIEELKHGDALSAVMSEFSAALPGVKRALIDERDRYMAKKIAAAPGKNVVAVLGAGHIPGIITHFGHDVNLEELDSLPPPSPMNRVLVWSFPVLLAVLMVVGFFRSGGQTSLQVFEIWAICNMIGAAVGAAVAFGHPLSILTAFLTGPFAAIHPVIAVGWLAALVEAFVRKPRVLDFESLSNDVTSARGLWKNRVSRIFLVLILANLGSVIGTAVGLSLAAKVL